MKWKVISASVRGSAHQRTGLPNQDAVDYGMAAKSEPAATVLAVSDGHGGGRHFRSQVGSMLAVHVTVETVREHVSRAAGLNGSADLSDLSHKIVNAWLSAVGSDLEHNPFTEEELSALINAEGEASKDSVMEHPELAYGATLLVAAATDDRVLYLQLGDGDILAVAADGATTKPIAADARLIANQTTSLCQPDAWREFRSAEIAAVEGWPALVLLSTDGYVNSFRSQEDFLQIGRDYLEMLRKQGSESLAEELPQILAEATQQGSGDDITLGMLHAEVLPAPVASPAAVGTPAATPSVTMRELTKERNTQKKKLTELETGVAGMRKQVLQLRLLAGAVVLIAVGALSRHYWLPLLHSGIAAGPAPTVAGKLPQQRPGAKDPGEGGPAGPVEDPAGTPIGGGTTGDPGAGTSKAGAAEWFLVVDGGKEIALTSGKTISSTEIVPDEARQAYARVKKQDNVLVLTNLSSDAWKVVAPDTGKESTYAKNDNLILHQGVKINFHKGASATLDFRGK
jgi:serine/threonine protein phosphatase PrpC